jgi:hypothetical protein
MGTNYFVVGYDHEDAEDQDVEMSEALRQVQALVRDAYTLGRVSMKFGLEDDDPLLVRAKAILFPPKRLHVGKSSGGWCFGLATHKGIQSLADWELIWFRLSVHIEDEYGQKIPVDQMRDLITKRSWRPSVERSAEAEAEWLRMNHAIKGPNGLARHTYQARIPDEGPSATYDLCEGRFR